MNVPAMDEIEYATRLAALSRTDLLKLCRAAGFSAHKLQSNESLIHLLWLKIGKRAAEAYVERVNEALRNLGCERKARA